MEDERAGRELKPDFDAAASGSQNDNKQRLSPMEDYNPLNDCT